MKLWLCTGVWRRGPSILLRGAMLSQLGAALTPKAEFSLGDVIDEVRALREQATDESMVLLGFVQLSPEL